MSDHFVTVEEVRAALTPPDIILCSCSDVDLGRKQLLYRHRSGVFVITRGSAFQYETVDINDAVSAYNRALSRAGIETAPDANRKGHRSPSDATPNNTGAGRT